MASPCCFNEGNVKTDRGEGLLNGHHIQHSV